MGSLWKRFWRHHRIWTVVICIAAVFVTVVLGLLLGTENAIVSFLMKVILPFLIFFLIAVCVIGEAFAEEMMPYLRPLIHTAKDMKSDRKRKENEQKERQKNGLRHPFYLEKDYKKKERMHFLIVVFAVTLCVIVLLTVIPLDHPMDVWRLADGTIERLVHAVLHMEILILFKELLSLTGMVLLTIFAFIVLAMIIYFCWGFVLSRYNRYQERKDLYQMTTTEEWREESCKKE